MKRLIGYSTGALAKGDFALGLEMLRRHGLPVVELSALRDTELLPLLESMKTFDLSFASYVSFHAPSRFDVHTEQEVAQLLRSLLPRHWPVILHPDAIADFACWAGFGEWLCIENMDKRKHAGRTVDELEAIFALLPQASLCFDIGHARQVDPTMGQAELILQRFGHRLRQVHMSEVNSRNGHDPMSLTAVSAFRKVAHLIPPTIPVVLETVIAEQFIDAQLALANNALKAGGDGTTSIPLASGKPSGLITIRD